VGNNLHKYGRIWIIYLLEDTIMSEKINDLLLLGYRLLNIGYVLVTLMFDSLVAATAVESMEFLGRKLGLILLILAFLHFQNIGLLVLFSKLKNKYKWQL
jgi:hypothetical protein